MEKRVWINKGKHEVYMEDPTYVSAFHLGMWIHQISGSATWCLYATEYTSPEVLTPLPCISRNEPSYLAKLREILTA